MVIPLAFVLVPARIDAQLECIAADIAEDHDVGRQAWVHRIIFDEFTGKVRANRIVQADRLAIGRYQTIPAIARRVAVFCIDIKIYVIAASAIDGIQARDVYPKFGLGLGVDVTVEQAAILGVCVDLVMIFDIGVAHIFAVQILTDCDADPFACQHGGNIHLIGLRFFVPAPAMIIAVGFGKVALIDKIRPAARRDKACRTINPTFVDLRPKVEAACDHIRARGRIIHTVMFENIARVDGVVTLPANHPIRAVSGQDRIVIIRCGIAVTADNLAQLAKADRADRTGPQERQDTAVAQNRIRIKATHIGIAGAVDHVAARPAKNDILAATGQDNVIAADAVCHRLERINRVRLTNNLQARNHRISGALVRRDRHFDGNRAARQAGANNIVPQTRRILILRRDADQVTRKVNAIRITDKVAFRSDGDLTHGAIFAACLTIIAVKVDVDVEGLIVAIQTA